jgi:hypothetical protein
MNILISFEITFKFQNGFFIIILFQLKFPIRYLLGPRFHVNCEIPRLLQRFLKVKKGFH